MSVNFKKALFFLSAKWKCSFFTCFIIFFLMCFCDVSAAEVTAFSGEIDIVNGRIVGKYSKENDERDDDSFYPETFQARFTLNERQLIIHSVITKNMIGHASVDLQYPYSLDGLIEISAMAMDDFLDLWMKKRSYQSKGNVTGEIRISGNILSPWLRGNLTSKDGVIKKFEYDELTLNISGNYPHMEILDSQFSRTDGFSYIFEGPIDLSDNVNFKKQLKSLHIFPLVSTSSNGREWTLKKKKESSSITEFKYFLSNDQTHGSVQGESDMLGVQRIMEF